MKKALLTLALILTLVFAFAACDGGDNGGNTPGGDNPPHVHVFDQKNVGDTYLKSEANESSPAEYYYSCKCGEKGNETFAFGNPIGDVDPGDGAHVFRNEWTYDDDKHWRSCIDLSCDARKNEANHTFGEWVVDEAATCAKAGTKHHTCVVCGKSVSETILVDPTAHNYATGWTSDDTNHWHKCQNSGCTSVVDKTSHIFGEWIVDEAATCQKSGTRHHVCTVCNKPVSESYSDATAHNYATGWTSDDTNHWHKCQNSGCTSVSGKAAHNMIEGFCTVCNYNTFYIRNGDYIYFGEYPQSLKAESVTVGTTTDSRGYYLGSDGFYYAKVTANPDASGYTFSSGAKVTDGTVYYFKVEPIRWRILSDDGTNALILCDSIIANKRYDDSSNNYANSEIRAWLNEAFYTTAFNDLQKDLINTVLVDNSVASTGYSSNPYACEGTNDKVFLLSYKEVTNTAYGFASDNSTSDTARRMTVSDYARATGAYMSTSGEYYGNGWWRLRSPDYAYSGYARVVYNFGYVYYSSVDNSYNGVVPALQIRLR